VILVDTSAWFASTVPADENYPLASQWLAENREPLVATDYILDETLTLLRARGEDDRAIRLGGLILKGVVARLHFLTREDIHRAWELSQRFRDKGWSFTDCTSKVFMERMGIHKAAAFDRHFHQFGSIAILPVSRTTEVSRPSQSNISPAAPVRHGRAFRSDSRSFFAIFRKRLDDPPPLNRLSRGSSNVWISKPCRKTTIRFWESRATPTSGR